MIFFSFKDTSNMMNTVLADRQWEEMIPNVSVRRKSCVKDERLVNSSPQIPQLQDLRKIGKSQQEYKSSTDRFSLSGSEK